MHRCFYALRIIITFCVVAGSSVAGQTTIIRSAAESSVKQTGGVEEAVKLETPTGNLYGTLLLPQSNNRVPMVLIIAGSGPTDRDGNSPLLKGPNDSLKLLAQGLAAHGIASLRYDKRGVGESGREMLLAAKKANKMPREEDFRFDSFIDDAVLWGEKLRGDKRFSGITIVGHSEGSLIGMVAARKMRADGFVSIAGAGRPAQQILVEQLKTQLTPDLLNRAEEMLNLLAAGKTISSVPPSLYFLFRPSVQPYMISWLRYSPAKEIAALTIPALIIQGTTDVQISVEDAKLLAATNPKAKLLIIEGMNHVLKQVLRDAEKQVASYSDPTLPVMPSLINEISSFISRAKK
jgi:pimeloyl-ACP methyl ester carboxylesterase